MTNKEKLVLLNMVEDWCWDWLNSSATAQDVRNILYSIEIIKEMRSDYDEEEGE